jgi:crotonobetainyl-CoA:carnitine CoA-transferase CaiB-like acyl-CoA transferase
VIAEIIKTKTADEWEVYFQARHVPAARVRTMAEAVADPHFAERRVFHHFDSVPGVDGPVGCRSPRSSSRMAVPASKRRRGRWAPTPKRCLASSATAPATSPACAEPE